MNRNISNSQIRIIRLALLGGILLFGVVAALVASGSVEGGLAMTRPGPLAGVVALLVIMAAGLVMFMRRRIEGQKDMDVRFKSMLVAHATCEAAALIGAVHILMTGGLLPYVAGLTVFVFSLVLLPIEDL
ncbi:MAG: hypothetical protein HKN29_15080 [Rhodothermales bacterium]|nr:hypothetical protein [Rhodothermales bacterium]